MANLIVLADIKEFRSVSNNLDTSRIDPLIAEAQELDIKPILGPAQYLDFINNIADTKYQELFNGVEYIDKGIKETVSFKGIRAALCYYSYARLLLNQDLHVTAQGLVHKTEQWSENADRKRVNDQVTAARAAAGAHENDYIKFLNEDSDNYPIWAKECFRPTSAKTAGTIISRITSGGSSQRSRNGRCYSCNRISRYCVC